MLSLANFSSNPITINLEEMTTKYRQWFTGGTIYYVLSDTIRITVHQQTFNFSKDDIILINPFEFHDIEADKAKVLILNISFEKYDRTVLKEKPSFDLNSQTSEQNESITRVKELIAELVKCYSDGDRANEILAKSLAYNLLNTLVSNFLISKSPLEQSSFQQYQKIEEILKYCSQNYNTLKSLSELAEQFHYTPQYMSKLFKTAIGETFSEYIDNIRLENLRTDILRERINQDELAEKHGFGSKRSMLEIFKKHYGISLAKYRLEKFNSKHSKISTTIAAVHNNDLHILSSYLSKKDSVREIEAKKILEVATLNINQPAKKFSFSFKRQCNVGHARNLLDLDIQNEIITVQKELGFQYIGFHGLLDDSMMIYDELEDGTPIFSHIMMDKIFDFLLDIKLKPIIELSYMPSKLAEEKSHYMFYTKSTIGKPKSYKKWEMLIVFIFNHLIQRYGLNEVISWPIQIWSTPDSGSDQFGFKSQAEFFDFYVRTYKIIHNISENFDIQSPSIRNNSLENPTFFNDFIEYTKKYDCQPKHINISFFPVDVKRLNENSDVQLSKRIPLLKSKDALKESIDKINKNNLSHNWNINKFIINAWNSSLSHRDLLNDTVFKATYIVRNVLLNHDSVASLAYWCLSDNIQETQLDNDHFHGGFGLFTVFGLKKAAYYAYELLYRLGDKILAAGEGYSVHKKADNTIQVMLYNYQHFNSLYAEGELFDMTLTNRYCAFEAGADMKVVIPIEGFTNGTYYITETRINKNNGSCFDKWLEMGAIEKLSKEDLEYLDASSLPSKKITKELVKDTKITISRNLAPHEVILLEVKKIDSV